MLVDFHHKLLAKRFPNEYLMTNDISEWFDKTKNLDLYYVYYLSLFVQDYILFENFLFDDTEESMFTRDKFLPSFEKVIQLFGVRPLIVPLLPIEYEKSNAWFAYDEKVQKSVNDMLS